MQLDSTVSPGSILGRWRIGICGAATVENEHIAMFCERLGEKLTAEKGRDAVIVTGGCKKREGESRFSVDWHVVQGAIRNLNDGEMKQRIETLLPDEGGGEIEKFSEGHRTVLRGKTPQARRFALASSVDVLVAVSGGRGTQQHLDLALALGRPILPVPFCDGRSKTCWTANKETIMTLFDIDEETATTWASLDIRDEAQRERAASEVAQKLFDRLKMRCMVIMPFDDAYTDLYEKAIKPATKQAGFVPIRTDYLNRPGDIIEMIYRGIRNCDCAIVVLTGFRHNVMYELGLAHAYEKPTVLLNKKGDELVFDIGNQNVIYYTDDYESLQSDIEAELKVAQNTFVAGRMLAFEK